VLQEDSMEANRQAGSVKWFSRVKGYGFIAPDDDGKEIFVHFSGIEGEGYRNLEQGQRVSYVVEDTPKGPQAVSVRSLEVKEEISPDTAHDLRLTVTTAEDDADARSQARTAVRALRFDAAPLPTADRSPLLE
jgi:CspA family cold shock protein